MTSRLALLLAVLLAPAVAAAPFTNADVAGTYGFTLARSNPSEQPLVGVLVLDGDGNVAGGSRYLPRHYVRGYMDVLTQQATGTYVLESDGRLRIDLQWTPELREHASTDSTGRQLFGRLLTSETWWGAMSGLGFRMFTRLDFDGVQVSPTGEVTDGDDYGWTYIGQADRIQAPSAPASAPRATPRSR
jgi:hypothetical protein